MGAMPWSIRDLIDILQINRKDAAKGKRPVNTTKRDATDFRCGLS
jgi:hypothetical protein